MNWRWYLVGLPLRIVLIGPFALVAAIGSVARHISDELDRAITIGRV